MSRRPRATLRQPRPPPAAPASGRHPPADRHADLPTTEIAARSPASGRRGVGVSRDSHAGGIRWSRRRVSGRAEPSGTPMRHLFSRLAPREIFLLPPLVIGPPRFLALVVHAGALHPLPLGQRRAQRAVAIASITPPADPHRRRAPRTRELPRLGIRHRSGVPSARAGQGPRCARSSMRSTVNRATAAVTRRSGMSPRASPLLSGHLRASRARQRAPRHERWVTSGEHTPGVFGERLSVIEVSKLVPR